MDKAEQARRSKVKVGFMGGKYPDGTPDAVVAAANEYGLGGLPERPFFRQSVAIMQQELPRVLPRYIDQKTLTVSHREANLIGAWAADVIKGRIADLQDPPNSPATLAAKQGDSPLQDTGHLGDAVSWEVE